MAGRRGPVDARIWVLRRCQEALVGHLHPFKRSLSPTGLRTGVFFPGSMSRGYFLGAPQLKKLGTSGEDLFLAAQQSYEADEALQERPFSGDESPRRA